MARNMPTASNGRQIGRPAQGKRTDTKFNRPRPSYTADNGTPVVKSRGTLSNPKDPGASFKGKLLVTDATPKVVQI